MTRVRILALALACVASLALPAAIASASSSQETIFEDDQLLLLKTPQIQDQILNELQFMGVDTIRALILWKTLVPGTGNETAKPAGDSSTPAYYPDAKWAALDRLVSGAASRGIKVIGNPASSALTDPASRFALPRWARNADKSPKVAEFKKFVTAVARRYNGASGHGKISRWSIWNEPNQGGWIQPQWKNGVARSAVIYRDLYNAGRSAIKGTSGHGGSTILFGELAPIGREKGRGARQNTTSPISPGRFLREVTCVDENIRAFRGSDKSKRGGCIGSKIRANGIAEHPYTKGGSSTATSGPGFSDEFVSGNIRGLISLTDRIAGRTGRLPRGSSFYSTEFGFQSNPPDHFAGTSLAKQAQFENENEYILYRQPRFKSFNHYLMLDDTCGAIRCGGFQTGLKFKNGALKPAYNAFQMPIVVLRAGNGKLKVWGAVRGRRGGTAVLQVSGKQVKTVRGNSRGYFTTTIAGGATTKVQTIDLATGGAARSRVATASSNKLR